MKIALVTGAFGFIGRHVALQASRSGFYVIGMGHGAWGRDEWRQWGLSEWHTCDIKIESLNIYANRPDLLVHCAGSANVAFSVTNPHQDFQRTVECTLDIVEYIRLNSPNTRLVLPSSAGVYGVVETMPIETGEALRPASPYGVHKMMAEQLCQTYARHFGLKVAIVRLFSVYGVGLKKQLLWDACMKLAHGDCTFAGTGLETRDWLHVEDAALLLVLAGERGSIECPIVNGGTGVAISIFTVIDQLKDALGKHSELICFTGASRPGNPMHYQASISGALEWGWVPTRDIEIELRKYALWFKTEVL